MAENLNKLSQSEWDSIVEDYRLSGLSAPAWCKINGIKVHQLRWQINKRPVAPKETQNIQWVEVKNSTRNIAAAITVNIKNVEIVLEEGFNKELFAEVINALNSLC